MAPRVFRRTIIGAPTGLLLIPVVALLAACLVERAFFLCSSRRAPDRPDAPLVCRYRYTYAALDAITVRVADIYADGSYVLGFGFSVHGGSKLDVLRRELPAGLGARLAEAAQAGRGFTIQDGVPTYRAGNTDSVFWRPDAPAALVELDAFLMSKH